MVPKKTNAVHVFVVTDEPLFTKKALAAKVSNVNAILEQFAGEFPHHTWRKHDDRAGDGFVLSPVENRIAWCNGFADTLEREAPVSIETHANQLAGEERDRIVRQAQVTRHLAQSGDHFAYRLGPFTAEEALYGMSQGSWSHAYPMGQLYYVEDRIVATKPSDLAMRIRGVVADMRRHAQRLAENPYLDDTWKLFRKARTSLSCEGDFRLRIFWEDDSPWGHRFVPDASLPCVCVPISGMVMFIEMTPELYEALPYYKTDQIDAARAAYVTRPGMGQVA